MVSRIFDDPHCQCLDVHRYMRHSLLYQFYPLCQFWRDRWVQDICRTQIEVQSLIDVHINLQYNKIPNWRPLCPIIDVFLIFSSRRPIVWLLYFVFGLDAMISHLLKKWFNRQDTITLGYHTTYVLTAFKRVRQSTHRNMRSTCLRFLLTLSFFFLIWR